MSAKSTFLAWVFRMPLIKRWGLMHCIKPENVAEHSHQVAVIAHLLVVIKNTRYGGDLNPDRAGILSIFHELSEVQTLDIPTPIKNHDAEFNRKFKEIEMMAEQQCLETLPEDLQDSYKNLIIQKEVDTKYKDILKAADIIAAYLKATDELRYGNREFDQVKTNLEERLQPYKDSMPEVADFLEIFAESCLATLDQLTA